MKDAVAVANPQRRVHDSMLADFGADVAYLNGVRGRFFRDAGPARGAREPHRYQSGQHTGAKARAYRICLGKSHGKHFTQEVKRRHQRRPTRKLAAGYRRLAQTTSVVMQGIRHLATANTQTTPPCGTSFCHPTSSLM